MKKNKEKIEKILEEYANIICANSRLLEAWNKTFGINNEKLSPSKRKHFGLFFRNFLSIAIEEDLKYFLKFGISKPDIIGINKNISKIAKKWYLKQFKS